MAAHQDLSVADLLDHAYNHVVEDENHIVFFLGAGASASAGIPLADGLIAKWRQRRGAPQDLGYSETMMETFPAASVRNAFFNRLCEGKQPSEGHKALAQLFLQHPEKIRLCVTTNFDGLVEMAVGDAAAQAGRLCTVEKHISHSEEGAARLRTHINAGNTFNVVKLHGDYSNTRNTFEEIDHLPTTLAPVVKDAIHRKPTMLIFIGYSGNDNGVVDWLRQCDIDDGSVYWCSSSCDVSPLIGPWLREKHFFHVKERDFDTILGALAHSFLGDDAPGEADGSGEDRGDDSVPSSNDTASGGRGGDAVQISLAEANLRTLFHDLNAKDQQKIMLEIGDSWEALAAQLDYPRSKIIAYRRSDDPPKKMLEHWAQKPGSTLQNLIRAADEAECGGVFERLNTQLWDEFNAWKRESKERASEKRKADSSGREKSKKQRMVVNRREARINLSGEMYKLPQDQKERLRDKLGLEQHAESNGDFLRRVEAHGREHELRAAAREMDLSRPFLEATEDWVNSPRD